MIFCCFLHEKKITKLYKSFLLNIKVSRGEGCKGVLNTDNPCRILDLISIVFYDILTSIKLFFSLLIFLFFLLQKH